MDNAKKVDTHTFMSVYFHFTGATGICSPVPYFNGLFRQEYILRCLQVYMIMQYIAYSKFSFQCYHLPEAAESFYYQCRNVL